MIEKSKNTRAARLLNEVGEAVWRELAKEYGPRSLKRIASAAMVTFEKLPHEGRVKAIAIANGEKNIELNLEIIPDEAEAERLQFRVKQIKAKIKKQIAKESQSRKNKKLTKSGYKSA